MKNISRSLSTNYKFLKIIEGIKLISIPGAAQLVIQILGLVGGILIIRLLPTKEYAFYTIANTMLGTMMLLADGGISTGVMAEGAKVWDDQQKLGTVIVTGLNLRRQFGIVIVVLVVPILVYLLRHNEASWLVCFLITLSIIPAFAADLSDSLLEIAPKLSQDLGKLQKNQIGAGIGRLLMIGSLLFIFPWTYIALLATGIPRFWANIKLRNVSIKYADLNQEPDTAVKKNILAIVKRILPVAVYTCFAGQVNIWLISVFGSTSAVADVGALGRISTLLTFAGSVFGMLIIPRFARMPNVPGLLLQRLNQILIGLFSLCLLIVLFIYLFPAPVLLIIGNKYANLQTELLLNIIGACVSLIAGSMLNLSLSKGWTINPFISILISIASIISGCILINISTIKGIFYFNIFVAFAEFTMFLTFILYKIFTLKKMQLAYQD